MTKKTIFMETTKKEPEDTISEITKLLRQYDMRDSMMNYEYGQIIAFSFTIQVGENLIPYKLPVNYGPLWILAQNGKTKYIRDEDQARRVAWRQILRWLEAQMALVDIEMVGIDQIFLPYMMVDNTNTVYDKYVAGGLPLLLAEKT